MHRDVGVDAARALDAAEPPATADDAEMSDTGELHAPSDEAAGIPWIERAPIDLDDDELGMSARDALEKAGDVVARFTETIGEVRLHVPEEAEEAFIVRINIINRLVQVPLDAELSFADGEPVRGGMLTFGPSPQVALHVWFPTARLARFLAAHPVVDACPEALFVVSWNGDALESAAISFHPTRGMLGSSPPNCHVEHAELTQAVP